MERSITKGSLSLREKVGDLSGSEEVLNEARRGSTVLRGLKNMKSLARTLRRQATDAECLLWEQLRNHRLNGFKFRRQVVIEPYIVDFVCYKAKLIIEADGGQHAEQATCDMIRTARLETLGYKVMRFWNHEILVEMNSVLEQIHSVLIEVPSPQPSPGGRGR